MSVEPVIICKANFGSPEFEEFLEFPWQVQGKDPCWVPPVLEELRYFLNPAKSWFFEIGEADLFLAKRGGKCVGRISAQTNSMHDERYKDDTGFFGFFECVDDQEVADALLDTAAAWLRERGKKRVVGPLSLSIYDEVGLLVEGFDSIPAMLQTHNPPYYATLVENYGFKKAIDWFALWLPNPGDLSKVPQDMEQRLKAIMDKGGLKLETPRTIDVMRRNNEVFELFNEAWNGNWGHLPFTPAQFKHIMTNLSPLLRSDLMRIITDSDGNIVAFIITIADLNATIKALNGKLSLFGKLRLFYEARFKPLSKVKTVLLGVKREYQRKMLHHALILSTYIGLLPYHKTCSGCDCSLIPETLGFYIKAVENFGAKKYKTFRVYEREI